MIEAIEQRSIQPVMPGLVDELLVPINGAGVGEDPLYGDDYTEIKQEIDKLSGSNFSLIARRCENILRYQSKDLRVAGYYTLASTFAEGLHGLVKGAELYYELISRFENECHPQREAAKLQAVAWLNNDKLASFAKNIGIRAVEDRYLIERLKSRIDSINVKLIDLLGSDVTTWTSLNQWIQKNLPSKENQEQTSIVASMQTLTVQPVQSQVREISSERAFARTIDELFAYLAKENEVLRLVSMSRAVKWSSLTIPASVDKKTQIEPPRTILIQEIKKPIESSSGIDKLLEIESYFMESSAQYWFDLQKYEIELAKSLGRNDLVDMIKLHLKGLLKARPELINLSYRDGMHFASEATRIWLKRELSEEVAEPTPVRAASSDLTMALQSIVQDSVTLPLAECIARLSKIETRDDSEKFIVNMARLEVCINANREDLALPLALKMEKIIEKYKLHRWNKMLALKLWNKLFQILMSVNTGMQPDNEKLDELKRKICATDMEYALKSL